MVEFFFQALVEMFTPAHLFFLMLGTILGLLVGILPGLGGIAGSIDRSAVRFWHG